jgi:hypothetical protein
MLTQMVLHDRQIQQHIRQQNTKKESLVFVLESNNDASTYKTGHALNP